MSSVIVRGSPKIGLSHRGVLGALLQWRRKFKVWGSGFGLETELCASSCPDAPDEVAG